MPNSQNEVREFHPHVEEIPGRLDEQHILTIKTLRFLVHPNIPITSSPTAKIVDIGTGSGAWLVDLARSLPSTCQFTGFDLTSSAFPPLETLPSNVSFKIHNMILPFPAAEVATYDIVAVRFTSNVIGRAEWTRCIANLMILLKPGGWLQWIDSCNFALYNSVPGTSRAACQEIYDSLDPFRYKNDDPVIGLMMRETNNLRRENVFRELGLVNVHEDVFSSDRLQDLDRKARDMATLNIMDCFVGCLEGLVEVGGSGWTARRIETLKAKAASEVADGVYHTLDQVCIIGRKSDGT